MDESIHHYTFRLYIVHPPDVGTQMIQGYSYVLNKIVHPDFIHTHVTCLEVVPLHSLAASGGSDGTPLWRRRKKEGSVGAIKIKENNKTCRQALSVSLCLTHTHTHIVFMERDEIGLFATYLVILTYPE